MTRKQGPSWKLGAIIVVSVLGCSSSRSARTGPAVAMTAGERDSAAPSVPAQASVMGTAPDAASAPTMVAVGGDAGSVTASCTAGMARSCCGTGMQICEGVEFVSWGPCLDASGKALQCAQCADQACDAGMTVMDAGVPARDAGQDAGPRPDAGHECGPGMECRPSSTRYCDESGIAEWTVSTCSEHGKWGACTATSIPPELDGVGDCSATSYSPESCCPQAQLCCQDGFGGLFNPFGSAACDALNCPP